MNFENLKKATYTVVFILGITFVGYLFMKYLFLAILPFLIGWFIAFAMRPLAAYLSERMKIRSGILRVMLTLLTAIVLVALVSVGVWALSREVWGFISGLGEGEGAFFDIFGGVMGSDGMLGRIFGELSEYVAEGLYNLVISLVSSLAGAISSLAVIVPKALFFALVTVIASVYFALDLERINAAVRSVMPIRIFNVIVRLKDGFLSAFTRYIRSYLILLAITFLEMLLGLAMLRAPYPLLMAVVIALLDLLPVIGVGTVLIPWGVWALISKNGAFGVGILILFAVHTVFRQLLEPKIVGKNLGVHPLLTLVFIYCGYSLFGFIGLILVPVFTVLVNTALSKEDTAKVDEGGIGK